MKLVKEHCEEFRHTRALDNVPKRDVKGSGTKAWVHKTEQPPDTENHALLYRVRWSIHALELKGAALNKTKGDTYKPRLVPNTLHTTPKSQTSIKQ